MSRKEKTIRSAFRCIRFVAVAAALVLIASSAMAAGIQVTKECPPIVAQGAAYQCTFLITNIDPDMQPITGLSVTDEHPLGTMPVAVPCMQGMSAVTTLAFGASCGGTLMLTAPGDGCVASDIQDVDEIVAIATSPPGTSGSTTNGPMVPGQVCEVDEFCRTAGFWGTHADEDSEKACSQNITETVLDAAGGVIQICGESICNTLVDDASSAVEALCVRVKGQQTRQLARQLTAARLNCIVSGETGGACDGVSINAIFDACNTACAADNTSIMIGMDEIDCIDALDCFNRGGVFEASTGICWPSFECSDNGEPCTPADLSNCEVPGEAECLPIPSCHDQDWPDDFLPNDSLASDHPCFEKQGPAGSDDECKSANKTPCTIIQPGEDECDTQDLCLILLSSEQSKAD